MRLTSTKKSITKGEVSVLAVVETLAAVTLVFYLSAHFDSLRWLALAMCTAPLLLLRTEESTRLGKKWFVRFLSLTTGRYFKIMGAEETGGWLIPKLEEKCEHSRSYFGLLLAAEFFKIISAPVFVTILPLICATFARFGATSWEAIRFPCRALKAVPVNWVRITLSMDLCFAPEVMPGVREFSLAKLLSSVRWFDEVGDRITFVVFMIPLFVPAFFYRWSLKATSIVYAPLVFVVHSTFKEEPNLTAKLKLIRDTDRPRFAAGFGLFLILAFLAKVVGKIGWNGFVSWWDGHAITKFLALYVVPNEVPVWQMASVLNSVLAIALLVFAREALQRQEVGVPLPEGPVQRALGFVGSLRWVLSLYTIGCTLYLTLSAATEWDLPKLGTKLFPWW